jgi:hypothetical protein
MPLWQESWSCRLPPNSVAAPAGYALKRLRPGWGQSPGRLRPPFLFSTSHRSANPPAMAVAPLSHSARDYVRAFDLTCIALWRDGRLGVSRNPTGAEEAWWCPAMAAGQIVNMLAVLSAVRIRITRGAPQPGPTKKGARQGAQFLLSTSYAFAWPQDKPLPKQCEPYRTLRERAS